MSIEDEIESGVTLNKEEAIKQVSQKLFEKNEQAKQCLNTIEALEQKISEEKEKYKTITEYEMPSLLDELGINGVTLPTGEEVRIDTSLHAGIPENKKEEAFEWLRNNNHSDLIKSQIVVNFGRNEDNYVGVIKDQIKDFGLKFEEKATVHNMTLKAFAKEQMRLGKPLPQDLFGVYICRLVEVKLTRGRAKK